MGRHIHRLQSSLRVHRLLEGQVVADGLLNVLELMIGPRRRRSAIQHFEFFAEGAFQLAEHLEVSLCVNAQRLPSKQTTSFWDVDTTLFGHHQQRCYNVDSMLMYSM